MCVDIRRTPCLLLSLIYGGEGPLTSRLEGKSVRWKVVLPGIDVEPKKKAGFAIGVEKVKERPSRKDRPYFRLGRTTHSLKLS